MTWFRLLLGHWVYHWHWAYSETELNHFERMKLTPSCGNEVATISNWAKGKFLAHRSLLGILAPLAALIAVLVWYFPLWQLSFNPSTQVDDEGPRGFYPTKEEMQADAEILRHRESWNKSMAGKNGNQCIVFLAIQGREAPADSQWRPNGPRQ